MNEQEENYQRIETDRRQTGILVRMDKLDNSGPLYL